MPMFPGGEAALLLHISEHTQYPEVAKENNIQGKVYVKFCVTSKGGVDKVSIFKGVDPELDVEAIRVVKTLRHLTQANREESPFPYGSLYPLIFNLSKITYKKIEKKLKL